MVSASDFKYKQVGSKTGTLTIGGAENRMKANHDWMYVPELKVCGTKEDIEKYCAEKEMDSKKVKKALKDAYTYSSIKNDSAVKKRFTKEVEASKAYNQAQTELSNQQAVDMRLDVEIGEILESYKSSKKERSSRKKPEASTPAKKKMQSKTTGKGLKARISKLDRGFVYDVTKMDEKGHHGAKAKWVKGGKLQRVGKKGHLAKLAFDPTPKDGSNPREGVRNALKNLDTSSGDVEKVLEELFESEEVVERRTPRPSKKKKPRTPKKAESDSESEEDLDNLVEDSE